MWTAKLVSVVTSLLPSLNSIEAVELVSHRENNQEFFQFCAPGSLPSLRHAEFVHGGDGGGFKMSQLRPFLKSAPNLQKLAIHAMTDREDLRYSRSPYFTRPDLDVVMTHLKEDRHQFPAP